MSFEIDEAMRAKMRKPRVSTFADIFFGLIADDPQADALPEEVFLAAVDEAYNQRTLRNIAKTITQAQPSPKSSTPNSETSTSANSNA